jgi:small subunit ribosomal protein S36
MRRWGRNPVHWIGLSWIGFLISFMLAVPIYQAPDEHSHVDRVLDTAVAGFVEYDENQYSADLLASARIMQLRAAPDPRAAEEAPARPQPNLADLSDSAEESGLNQLANHPPAYYSLLGAVSTAITALLPKDVWQHDLYVLLLRLLTMAMIAPLPWIFARTAANLRMRAEVTWVAAAVPLTIPQLAHIGSTVNNDNLLVLATSLSIMVAARVLTDGLSMQRAVAMSAAGALALQTKIFGMLLWPFLGIVCLVVLARWPRQWRGVLVVGAIMTLGSWTYLRNLLVYGDPYPSQGAPGAPPDVPGFVVDWSDFLSMLAYNTSGTFFGRFGWLYIHLPGWWTTALSILAVLAIAITLIRPRLGLDVRIMMLPAIVVCGLYFYTSYVSHARTSLFPAEQGRYLYPALASLAIAVAVAYGWRWPRWILTAMSAIAVAGYVMSMWLVIETFWGGARFERFDSIQAWSPLGSASLILLGLGGALVVGGLIAVQIILARPAAGRAGGEHEDAPAPEPEALSARA